ncbi:MAG: glycosyltransferase family 4 protein, partial [Bacteroidota bacterium]
YHWSRDPITADILTDKSLKEKLFPKDKLCLLYSGTMGPAQSLVSILKTAQLLQSDNVHFTFVGAGIETEDLKKFAAENQITNVSFHPRVASKEVSQFLNSADVLMAHLKKDPLFKITIPSKTIVYMKVGKPILMGIDGNAAELVKNAGAGKVCIPDDVEDIKEKVLQFAKMSKSELRQLGANGKDFYEKYFTIENNTTKYLQIFEELVKKK